MVYDLPMCWYEVPNPKNVTNTERHKSELWKNYYQAQAFRIELPKKYSFRFWVQKKLLVSVDWIRRQFNELVVTCSSLAVWNVSWQLKQSVTVPDGIVYPEAMEAGKPKIGGVMDPRQGTIDKVGRCKTCNGKMHDCPGHFGHVNLAKPVFYGHYIPHIRNVLKCICFSCSKILVDLVSNILLFTCIYYIYSSFVCFIALEIFRSTKSPILAIWPHFVASKIFCQLRGKELLKVKRQTVLEIRMKEPNLVHNLLCAQKITSSNDINSTSPLDPNSSST